MKKVRTFASAFALKTGCGGTKEAFFESIYIKQIIVVQEARRLRTSWFRRLGVPRVFRWSFRVILRTVILIYIIRKFLFTTGYERSGTETSSKGEFTSFLGAIEEKACFLFRATTEAV